MSAEFPIPLLMAAEGLILTPIRTIMGSGAGAKYRTVVLADGPVAYYRLGVVNPLNDETSNNLDMAWFSTAGSDTAGLLPAVANRAREFDGVSEYATIANDPLLRPGNGSWTAEFWAVLTNVIQNCAIVGMRRNASPFEQWSVNIANNVNPGSAPGKQLQFSFMASVASSRRWYLTDTEYCDDTAHHFVVVFDSADDVRFYVDGAQDISLTSDNTGALWPTVDLTTEPTQIGYGNGFGGRVDGTLDEVAFYAKALSDGAILRHYEVGVGL